MNTKYLEKINIDDDAVLDELLREALSSKEEGANAPEVVLRSSERKKSMKNKKWIAAAAAAAVCLMIPAGVYASSKATFYVSNGSPFNEITSFDKKDEVMADAEVDFEAIEAFSNGYVFDNMNVQDIKKLDEADNQIGTFKQWDAYYKNAAGDRVFVDVHQTQEEEADYENYAQKTREVTRDNGEIVTVYYTVNYYKFVPVDYELTAEDIENEARPDYFISYGSDEIEEKTFTYVDWQMDGQTMNIMAFDTPLSADEMLDMAAEMIK